jgi:hypothetical protein
LKLLFLQFQSAPSLKSAYPVSSSPMMAAPLSRLKKLFPVDSTE